MESKIHYKSFDGKELGIDLFVEKTDKEKYPLIVFFFGGGWTGGSVDQFRPQAEELIKLGYMVANVDYRVFSRDNTTIDVCMRDAFYSLKHLGDNAEELSIDTENVFLSGGSAGGHLALSCAIFNNIEHNLNIKGLFLFNPVTDTTKNGFQNPPLKDQAFNPMMFSPYHHITKDLPPVLLMHGKDDVTVLVHRAMSFADKYQEFGNSIELVVYDGCTHGFFNYKDGNNLFYAQTMEKTKEFIKAHITK